MTNHQNTNMEFSKSMQELWFATLMHSTDIETAHQELRQSIIEAHQSLQDSLDASYEKMMLDVSNELPEEEREKFLQEMRDMRLETYKRTGMDEQGSKARLGQELIELENIKNQVIATKKQRKTSFFIAIIIVLIITIGVYVLR